MKTKNQSIGNRRSWRKVLLFLFIGVFALEGKGQTDYTLNSGTTGTSTTWGFVAINTGLSKGKSQYLVRASELTALGAGPGNITHLALNVSGQPGRDMNNFNIKIGTTSINVVDGNFQSTMTTVYSRATQVRTALTSGGWRTFAFDNSFLWDGVSNLIVEICWDNGSSSTSGGGLAYHIPFADPTRSSVYHTSSTNPACGYNATAGTTSWWRPQFRFTIAPIPVESTMFHNVGSAQQLVFNNSYLNFTHPRFRVSSVTNVAYNRYRIEINTKPDFSGTTYSQEFTGAYTTTTQYDLLCNSLSPALPTTNNVTYYVRARASHDNGTSWGQWSNQVHSFTYRTDCPIEWYQTEYGQFDGNDIQGLKTNDAANDYMDVDNLNSGGIGNTTVGSNSVGLPQSRRLFSRITLPTATTITHLKAYLSGASIAGTSYIWIGIYNSAGTLLGDINQVNPGSVNAGWREHPLRGGAITVPAGEYYIAFHTTTGTNALRYEINVGEPNGEIGFSPNWTSFVSPQESYFTNVGPLPASFITTSTYRYNLAITGAPNGGLSTNNANTLVQLASFVEAESWNQLSWVADENGGEVLVQVLYNNGTDLVLIPDAALPGNGAGYTVAQSPVDLSGLNTTTYGNIYLRVSMENGAANPGPRFYSWTVSVKYEESTPPSAIDGVGATCFGGSVTLEPVGGVLAPGHQWAWYTGSCGGNLVHIGDTYTVSPSETTTYYVGAIAANGCPSSPCASGTVTLPTIGTTLAIDEDDAVCLVNSNNFIHFFHSSGRLIASINSQGQNLGNVTMTAYVEGSPVDVPACGNSTVITTVMNRHWVITPQFQPTSQVIVRLPYDDTPTAFGEYNMLFTAANNNSNLQDDLLSYAGIKLSKYSGPLNVDDDALNNCPGAPQNGSGGTTIHSQIGAPGGGLVNTYIVPFAATARYVDYGISGFSEFWLHGQSADSPLPVELSSMNISCQSEKEVQLNWSTASENNNNYFEVQRSRNSINWETAGFVNSSGNSSLQTNYVFTDQQALSGESYYRLLQVDYDGTETVLGPWGANCDGEFGVNVYPNPSNGNFTVSIFSDEVTNNASLMIQDISGKIISILDFSIGLGNNAIQIKQNDLAKGTYFVVLHLNNKEVKPVKIVVQ